MSKRIASIFIMGLLLLLYGCGGDEEVAGGEESDETGNADETDSPDDLPPEPNQEIVQEEPEPLDPNGFYRNTGDVSPEGKPVYKDAEGFFLWFGGGKWNLSDKNGGGNVIATSRGEKINDSWTEGSAKTHPEKDFLKEATYRLAVACLGSSDYDSAYTMFTDFVNNFNEDKLVPKAYLNLGDIVIGRIDSEVQPIFAEIDESRKYYAKVRQLSREAKLVNDSTFNEGDLIERIAGNPEGITDEIIPDAPEYLPQVDYAVREVVFYKEDKKHYQKHTNAVAGTVPTKTKYWRKLTAVGDKDNDGALSQAEFQGVERLRVVSFSESDLNGDGKIDYEELSSLLSIHLYKEMGKLYQNYKKECANLEGAQLSRATHKIGLAFEKQNSPEEMLRVYDEAINQFGNDPNSVGTDEILKIYTKKYENYYYNYTRTLALLDVLENRDQNIKFTVNTRTGKREVSSTVQEVLENRRNLIPWLNEKYTGMDEKVRTDVVNLRTGIKPSWIKATRSRFQRLLNKFPSDLAPKEKFKAILNGSSGKRTLELRMRWILDEIGAGINDGFTTTLNDFSAASPSVLLWMGRKAYDQGDSGLATAALSRLVDMYSDSGEFVFDAYVLLGDIEMSKGDSRQAERHYAQAYNDFAFHPRASEAQIKLGDVRILIGGEDNDNAKLFAAEEAYGNVMENEELDMNVRAEAMFKMGETRFLRRDYIGACDYYRQVYNGFPGALTWARKSFDQAIRCYRKLGDTDSESKLDGRKEAWERKFDAN